MSSEQPTAFTWRIGRGGWVRIDDEQLPGPLYLCLGLDRGRAFVTDFYLDGRGQEITGKHLRDLPITSYAAIVSETSEQRGLLAKPYAGPDLSRLASHFDTRFSRAASNDHWVQASFMAQVRGSGVRQAPMGKDPEWVDAADPDSPPPLPQPSGALTDGFLESVARYYRWCIANRRRPAPTLARALGPGTNVRTVQSWFAQARKRGLLPPTTPGRAS